MNIAFDMSFTETISNKRGIGQYNRNLIETIKQLDNNHSYYYYYPNTNKRYFNSKKNLSYFLESNSIDIFHITSPFDFITNYHPNKSWFNKTKVVVTLFDLIPLLFPNIYLNEVTKGSYFETLQFIKSCDIIFAISQATKNDAVTHSGFDQNKIDVIMGGIDNRFEVRKNLDIDIIKNKYKIMKPYILFSGGIEYRKNLRRFLEAFCKLPHLVNQFQIVIFNHLDPNEINLINHLASELGIKDNLVLTGFVPIDELINIYNGADLFVFPSLYEGLGLPVLEAMACGVPVLTSNTSSLNEISGEAAFKINPENVEEISKGLEMMLLNKELQDQYRMKGLQHVKQFNWESVGKKVLKTYKKLESENHYKKLRSENYYKKLPSILDDKEENTKKFYEIFSELFKLDNEEFIYHLYKEILLREPDEHGYNHHIEYLTKGMIDKISLLSIFILSNEANKIFSSNDQSNNHSISFKLSKLFQLDSETFSIQLFEELINREPTSTELMYTYYKLSITPKIELFVKLLNSSESKKIYHSL